MGFRGLSGQLPGRGFGLAVSLCAVGALLVAQPASGAPRFERDGLGIERKRAFDFGVTDYDGDGRLDLFSTNHMFRDSLLRGTGSGNFEDVYESAGFAPNPRIPGIEALTRKPRIERPGLYMFVRAGKRRPNIRIATKNLREVAGLEEPQATGKIALAFPKVKVRRQSNAAVRIERSSRRRTVVRFEARANARIVLRPNHIDLPFRMTVDEPLPTERIYLGSRGVTASERKFTVALGDRHGVAWGDYDRDGRPDAFITGGGLAGNIKQLPRARSDELLLSGPERLADRIEGSGIRKGNCRGRQAATFDYDGDGVLDLFAGCRQGRPRLYRGRGDGTFKEKRRALRAISNRGTVSRFVDLDNDGRLEYVDAGKFFARVWSLRRGGRARLRQTLATPNDDKNVEALAPGDYDNDGDLDLFLSAPSGNSLLVNRRGRLAVRDPGARGLPGGRGAGAAWVDYDNDGDLDLHTAPGGLFVNRGGSFRESGKLAVERSTRFARASWFDADGDGRRDLAQLTQRGRGLFPTAELFRNRSAPRNHWLALDLRGRRGNRQAVGARVRLRAGRRTLTQWVGQNEGSRYGQGHYRLYFGLGRKRRARGVTVLWPDGGRTRVGTVAADRLRTISRRSGR